MGIDPRLVPLPEGEIDEGLRWVGERAIPDVPDDADLWVANC